MEKVVIDDQPEGEWSRLTYKGRTWMRSNEPRPFDDSHWWEEVLFNRELDLETWLPVMDEEKRAILDEFYDAHLETSKIRRFPRLRVATVRKGEPASEDSSDTTSEPQKRSDKARNEKTAGRSDSSGSEAQENIERSKSSTPGEPIAGVPRTKWGTRITSNDKKHYFGIGVWKSTKYGECSTVRLSVAGRTYMYTLDKTQMKALRREISRGVPT